MYSFPEDKKAQVKLHLICSACPKGTKRGTEFPCPAGTYNNRTGLERVQDCVPCITGHYCPQGTTNPRECPRGTFNDVLGAKVSNIVDSLNPEFLRLI